MNEVKLKARFHRNIEVDLSTHCWNWKKHRSKWGYGSINVAGKIQLAHRVAYELWKEKIPEGLCVLHHCDNPACVNPQHLFTGTNLDNIKDKVSKNRQGRAYKNRGTYHPGAKLTEQDVLNIRASSLPQSKLAELYSTTQSNISVIKNKRNWNHI